MTHGKGILNSKRKSTSKSMAKMETGDLCHSRQSISYTNQTFVSFTYVLFFLCQFSERISPSLFKILSKTAHTSSNLLSSSAAVPYNHITNVALSAVSLCAGTVPPCNAQWQLLWHFDVHFIAHSPTHSIYNIPQNVCLSVCLSVTLWTAQSSSDS
jgi:hypothetical protein